MLSFSGNAQLQKAIDSIERLLPAQKDTALVNSYNELTKLSMKVDRIKSKNYANKALALSRQIKYNSGEALAAYYHGILNISGQKLDSALAWLNKSLQIRKRISDKKGIARIYLKISIINQMLGNLDKTLEYAQMGLKGFREINDESGTGDALMAVGIANESFGNVDAALNYYQQSLAIRKRANDVEVLSVSYLNIGNAYFIKKDYSRARGYYMDADSIATITNDYSSISLAAHNLAAICDETNTDYQRGLDYAETAFSIREQLGNTRGMVSTLNVFGSLLKKVGKYKLAEEKLLTALRLAETLTGRGLKERTLIYRSLTKLFEATKDYPKAIEAAKLTVVYNDSVYVSEMNESMAEMEVKYQSTIKDQEIQRQKFAILKRNYLIFSALGLLCLGIVLAFSYTRRQQLKKDRQLQAAIIHQQDIASKGIIEAEERERKRIAGDLHDGLGQLFSAVKMNMNIIGKNVQFNDRETALSFDKTMSLVDESCKEVRSISHQMMPNTLLKYGLASAVRDFINNIDTRQLKVNLEISGLNERLDSNTETVLYRVLQETVNNVIKHSGASNLDIQLNKDEEGITATIEDNGKGFDKAVTEAQDGIGLKNIRTRVEFLKGNVEFDSTPGRGTVVSVWVPVIQAA